MHFVVFVPREHDAGDPAATLERVGLADLILGATSRRLADESPVGAGTLYTWDRESERCEPKSLAWVRAVPAKGLPAGRYHLGFSDKAWCVEELARPYQYPGLPVSLGAGQTATIPRPYSLPYDARIADDGTWRFELQRWFHAYGIRVDGWRARVAAGTILDATCEELIDFALASLRLNYRLPPEAVSHLKLLCSDTVRDVFFAAQGVIE